MALGLLFDCGIRKICLPRTGTIFARLPVRSTRAYRPRHSKSSLIPTSLRKSLAERTTRCWKFAGRFSMLLTLVYAECMRRGCSLSLPVAAKARIVAIPDADWTPEMLAGLVDGVPAKAQFARRLAENGCQVLVPMLINRDDTFSGNPEIRMTNEPHREFIYRIAYELGRHVIGYEVQKVLAAVDWFSSHGDKAGIGVMGYGEGGLIALYAAALDSRIKATVVSGYFDEREKLWSEPIYRNIWGLLREFGDAEIASLIAPRTLIVEACRGPEVNGPPAAVDGRSNMACPVGRLSTPPIASVRREADSCREIFAPFGPGQLVEGLRNIRHESLFSIDRTRRRHRSSRR